MKLSTPILKQKIAEWLSDPALKPDIVGRFLDSKADQKEIDHVSAWFKFKPGATYQRVADKIFSIFTTASQWKRVEKRRLGEGSDYIYTDKDGATFADDGTGAGSDQTLVTKYAADPVEFKRCWLRVFVPSNELADTFRLELVTTPDDDDVVGWLVVAD